MAFPVPNRDWLGRLGRLIPLGDGWVQVFGFGPGIYPEITRARAIAAFKGFLYVGACHRDGLQVLRSVDGVKWYPCVGPKAKTAAGFGVSSNGDAFAMAVLDSDLYVGTNKGIWISSDGDDWKPVSVPMIAGSPIWALAGFAGYMYAATGTHIWRGKGQTGWTAVVGDPPAKVKAGFGDSEITDITSLAVLDGKLYAGAGLDNPLGTTGISIWRTGDGETWLPFKKATTGLPVSLHVHAMAPFGVHLYVGGYHVLRVYRTDGSAGSWIDVTDGVNTGGGNDGAWAMAPYAGKFYLGAKGVQNGKILWATSSGQTWTAMDTKPVGADKYVADALVEFRGHLYLTTRRHYKGPVYPDELKLEIWRYGPRWAPEDYLIRFVKPLLARIPFPKWPPPVAWLGRVKAWFGRAIAKARELIRKR